MPMARDVPVADLDFWKGATKRAKAPKVRRTP